MAAVIKEFSGPEELYDQLMTVRREKFGARAENLEERLRDQLENKLWEDPDARSADVYDHFDSGREIVQLAVEMLQKKGFTVKYKRQLFFQTGYWKFEISGWEKRETTTPDEGPYRDG
jgi:hypothetical protein